MQKITTHVLKISHLHKLFIVGLVCFLGILGALYTFFVHRSVINAVAVRDLSADSAELSSEVSVLEGRYFTAKRQITVSRAQALGLVEATPTRYITRTSLGGLSVRDAI